MATNFEQYVNYDQSIRNLFAKLNRQKMAIAETERMIQLLTKINEETKVAAATKTNKA